MVLIKFPRILVIWIEALEEALEMMLRVLHAEELCRLVVVTYHWIVQIGSSGATK